MKHLMILVALLLVVSMSFSQQVADFDFTADVTAAGGALLLSLSQGAVWTTLLPGQAYECVADQIVSTTNITPLTLNAETFTPGEIVITGAPGASVVLSFILPVKLYPQAGIGSITMSYTNFSASLLDINTSLPAVYWNPQVARTVTLDAAGSAVVWFGGNPSVSGDATDGDTFIGYGIAIGEYTGM